MIAGCAITTARVGVHGIELEVVRGGSGPPVLLLHGPTAYSPETPVLELLGRHAEVIAPSAPGFGESSRPDDFDTVYDLAHCCQDLLDTLPYDKVTLIGCSFGGWIAAELAVNEPRRFDRLVLIDPLGIKVGGREDRDITHVFNTSPAELARRAWHDPSTQRPGLLGLGWQEHLDTMSDEEMVRMARGWDALCLYAWRPHLYNPRLKDWLHRISMPTLLLWGASDRIVAPGYAEAYARLIPGSRMETVAEAGHHPDLEQPERSVEQIAAFLSSTSR
jgi:pimeloyl-ACP methyl ester carboxylesterase